MGFSRIFKNVVFFLIFIQLLVIPTSSTASPASLPPPAPPSHRAVIKNRKTSSLFLTYSSKHHGRRHILLANKKTRRSKTMKNRKNKVEFDWDNRVFSAMLPKGNVPPSGSSSCHNDNPNSVATFCTFSSGKPRYLEKDP